MKMFTISVLKTAASSAIHASPHSPSDNSQEDYLSWNSRILQLA